MPRKLRDSVVVITGASSGIGRATALKMAEAGAAVVVAARSEQPLRQVATECKKAGSRAIAVPADVNDETAIRRLADRAIETFGRVDVWVNNAAVSVIGRFEDVPIEAIHRVLDTNLLGYINGARAALACFREQGSGVLINISSQVALGGQPYASAYVMSKYAIRGLTDCLRQELLGTDIHVCTVLPGSIDTPHFLHAANYTGKAVKPLAPILDAERVATAIARLAEHPKHEIMVGQSGRAISALHGVAPSMYERAAAWKVDHDQFEQDATAEPTNGNLFEPMPSIASVSGGWRMREAAYKPSTAVKFGLTIAASVALIGVVKSRL